MPLDLKDHHGKVDFGPVWGCVLIGGGSTRMGKPKHLMKRDGITWLELIVSTLRQKTEQVVISGKGYIPDSLKNFPVVEDVPGMNGPLAGILAVLRKYPEVSWLVVACDMPDIEDGALNWLLEQRRINTRAILPDLKGNGLIEPLFAYYDHNCLELIEKIVSEGSCRPGDLVGKPGVHTPVVPQKFHHAWKNCNFFEDIAS